MRPNFEGYIIGTEICHDCFKLVVVDKTYESRYLSGNFLCTLTELLDLLATIENDMNSGYEF